jgi:HPt (histidine-containing phosphotransfer) domain-containing protein
MNFTSSRLELLQKDCGHEVVKTLIQIFKVDYKTLLDEFPRAIEDKDYKKIQFSAHRMKSGAENIGATPFSKMCEAFEYMDSNSSSDELKELFNKLQIEFANTNQNLDQFLELN